MSTLEAPERLFEVCSFGEYSSLLPEIVRESIQVRRREAVRVVAFGSGK